MVTHGPCRASRLRTPQGDCSMVAHLVSISVCALLRTFASPRVLTVTTLASVCARFAARLERALISRAVRLPLGLKYLVALCSQRAQQSLKWGLESSWPTKQTCRPARLGRDTMYRRLLT